MIRREINPTSALLYLIAIAVSGSILFVTHTHRVGISPDSVHYARSASSLLERGTLRVPITPWDSDQSDAPLSRFPPLLPCTLALLGYITNSEPANTARWLNAFCLLLSALALISLLPRTATNSLLIIGLLLGKAFYPVHFWLWSEPLFLTFCLLALWISQSRFATEDSALFPILLSLACGLATLTRYAGLFTLPCGLGLIFLRNTSMYVRLKQALLFLAFYLALVLPWFVWINSVGHAARTVGIFTDGLWDQVMREFAETLTRWVLPNWLSLEWRVLLFSIGFVSLALPLFRHRNGCGTALRPPLGTVGMLWFLGYCGFVILARLWADPTIPFDNRMLSPAAVFLVVFAGSTLRLRRVGRPAGIALFLFIAMIVFENIQSIIPRVRAVREGSIGYASQSRQRSETIAWLRGLPPNTTIFSNDVWAITALLPVTAKSTPYAGGRAHLGKFGRRVEAAAPSVLVLFKQELPQVFLTGGEIIEGLKLRNSQEFPDAKVFSWGIGNIRSSDRLLPLLASYPPDELTAYPVRPLVNNPANDFPACQGAAG